MEAKSIELHLSEEYDGKSLPPYAIELGDIINVDHAYPMYEEMNYYSCNFETRYILEAAIPENFTIVRTDPYRCTWQYVNKIIADGKEVYSRPLDNMPNDTIDEACDTSALDEFLSSFTIKER